MINECHKKEISTIIVSSKFRKQQWYFKPYARKSIVLKSISKIFTIDKDSENLLISNGFKNMLYSGDTRYDQVLQEPNISKLQNLKLDHKCIILGSSWMKKRKI